MVIVPKPQTLKNINGKTSVKKLDIQNAPTEAAKRLKKLIRQCGIELIPGGTPVVFSTNASLPKQGYTLRINRDIRIEHNGGAGAFYAAVTLAQIISQVNAYSVNNVEISDCPDLKIRGLMLDISRNRVQKVQTLKKIIDYLADIKINHLQFYVEGMSFVYKSYKHLYGNPDNWLTESDVKELDKYCKQYFIELVPNQNSFGHMTEWLAQKEFNHLAECPEGFSYQWISFSAPGTLNPALKESEEFVDSLFKDLLPAYSSEIFNIGGDEPFELGLGKSREAVEKFGRSRVYLDFMKKVFALADKYGKRVMLWGDVIKEHPEMIPEIPKDVTLLEWGYLPGRISEDACKQYAEKGLNYMVCPGTNLWSSISGKTDNMLTVLKDAVRCAKKHSGAGVLFTDWCDGGGAQQLACSFLPYAAGAAYGWNTTEQDGDITEFISKAVYKDKSGLIGKILFDLGNYYKLQKKETFAPALFRVIFTLQTDSINFGDSHTDPMFKVHEEVYLSTEEYKNTLAYLEDIKLRLADCRIECGDKELLESEIEWSVDYLIHSCRLGIFKTDYKSRSAEKLRDLAEDLERLNKLYKTIWNKRNKLSGYNKSSMRARVLLNKYKAILSYND